MGRAGSEAVRLGILGNGPAAHLAALAARAAGAEVLWAGPPRADAPAQAAHIHILRPDIADLLTRLDPALGARQAAATEPAHLWIGADGTRRLAPRLTRARLERVLADACAAAGLGPDPTLDPLGDPSRWPDPGRLWIDATGAQRALARRADAMGLGALVLDDLGEGQLWQTRLWPAALPGAPFTGVSPGRLYVQADHLETRATGPVGLPDPAGLPLPPGPPATVLRMAGPPVRQARFEGGSPVLLFGDARLQTPPAMGFGLLGAVQQAEILARCLRAGDDPEAALADWAEGIWMGAGLAGAWPDIAAPDAKTRALPPASSPPQQAADALFRSTPDAL